MFSKKVHLGALKVIAMLGVASLVIYATYRIQILEALVIVALTVVAYLGICLAVEGYQIEKDLQTSADNLARARKEHNASQEEDGIIQS